MTIKTIKTIFAISILTIFFACKEQIKSASKQGKTNTAVIGKPVTALDNQIWKIFQDKNEDYWFGSNGNGIYHHTKEGLIQYTTIDGLIDNQIRGIQADSSGNIYIETPRGVSKFDGVKFTTLEVKKLPDSEWKNEPTDFTEKD